METTGLKVSCREAESWLIELGWSTQEEAWTPVEKVQERGTSAVATGSSGVSQDSASGVMG